MVGDNIIRYAPGLHITRQGNSHFGVILGHDYITIEFCAMHFRNMRINTPLPLTCGSDKSKLCHQLITFCDAHIPINVIITIPLPKTRQTLFTQTSNNWLVNAAYFGHAHKHVYKIQNLIMWMINRLFRSSHPSFAVTLGFIILTWPKHDGLYHAEN